MVETGDKQAVCVCRVCVLACLCHLQELVVGDDDERVDLFPEQLDRFVGLRFQTKKRPSTETNKKNTENEPKQHHLSVDSRGKGCR